MILSTGILNTTTLPSQTTLLAELAIYSSSDAALLGAPDALSPVGLAAAGRRSDVGEISLPRRRRGRRSAPVRARSTAKLRLRTSHRRPGCPTRLHQNIWKGRRASGCGVDCARQCT